MSGIKSEKSVSQMGIKQSVSRGQVGHKSYGYHAPMIRTNTTMKNDSHQGIQNDSNNGGGKMEPMGLNVKPAPRPKIMNIEKAKKMDRNGYNQDKNFVS